MILPTCMFSLFNAKNYLVNSYGIRSDVTLREKLFKFGLWFHVHAVFFNCFVPSNGLEDNLRSDFVISSESKLFQSLLLSYILEKRKQYFVLVKKSYQSLNKVLKNIFTHFTYHTNHAMTYDRVGTKCLEEN